MKVYNIKTSLTVLFLTIVVFFRSEAQTKKNELDNKEQSIISISAQTASGNLKALKIDLAKGLDNGLTVNEIKEVIVHCYAYCGFPRSIRGLQTFMTVLEERKAKGIVDVSGTEASTISTNGSKYDRGKATLEKLTGATESGVKTGYAAFAPVMEVFLKEHLFADIFERDVLTFANRELVTISVISSIGDAEPMLRSHMNICLNVGITPDQLKQFVQTVQPAIGKAKAKAAEDVLVDVLSPYKKN